MPQLTIRSTTPTYDLADRFRVGAPPTLLTGVQALARLFVEHRASDRRRGLRTATFVSGYQGSPLGGLDRQLAGMSEVLAENDIRFVPGLNEEIAATAVWGSQIDLPRGEQTHDGITGFWYGKGPGLDRATDALRHANLYGVNPRGGMVLLVGDDPAAKSSTVPVASERSLAALGIPVLYPRNASEIVTLGLHAVEMSRTSGCVVALKIVADVADGTWVVDDEVSRTEPVAPQVDWAGGPFRYEQRPMILRPDVIVAAEADLLGPRIASVQAYARANGVDVVEVDPEQARLGIVAGGSCFDSLRQALADLGVADADLERAGIRVLRLGLMSPIDPKTIRAFGEDLDHLLVVEDKASFIETQIREILYGTAAPPRILGKRAEDGTLLVPTDGELTAGRLHGPLRRVLKGRVEVAPPASPTRRNLPLLSASRTAYFCSGCPHNRSTALPEGSMGGGGIGCHAMVTVSEREDSEVTGVTQMGGEGAQWIGQAGFTDVGHIFQNVGDGTFFHSGQLALQACVAAGVNITYKILYNAVVAMTGAQDAEGALSVPELTHKLAAEGVRRIVVCADEPGKHKRRDLAKGTLLWHRDRLDEAQRMLRDVPGVTVLIYDQHCAADARRQRKRGALPTRTKRIVINEAVCEGCGDCGMKSNCLSVQPVETEHGRKTRIDQTSCNTDYTCVDGDCPSFVVVETDPSRRPRRRGRAVVEARKEGALTPPSLPDRTEEPVVGTRNVFMVGIGGTGIVTVNQVLATAALRAGYEVQSLDQTGLSQKAGPVVGHLRFSSSRIEPSNRLTPGSADCILGFDLLALAEERNLAFGNPAVTTAVVSSSPTPTGAMVYDAEVRHPEKADLLERIDKVVRNLVEMDALQVAEEVFGDTVSANFLLVGAAYESGSLSIPAASIEEAIEINGTAVAANVAAFRWGRAIVAVPEVVAAALGGAPETEPTPAPASVTRSGLEGELLRLVTVRATELVGYQGEEVADDYVARVTRVAEAERAVAAQTPLAEAVARNLYRLTAYKDEYEVARLLTDPTFLRSTAQSFPGGEVSYLLHPPALRALGRTKKIRLGGRSTLVLSALARMRFLRGTRADVFGYARVRRVERALRDHYRELVDTLSADLSVENHASAVAVAKLPELIRGYEEVKLRNVSRYLDALRTHGVAAPALPDGVPSAG